MLTLVFSSFGLRPRCAYPQKGGAYPWLTYPMLTPSQQCAYPDLACAAHALIQPLPSPLESLIKALVCLVYLNYFMGCSKENEQSLAVSEDFMNGLLY